MYILLKKREFQINRRKCTNTDIGRMLYYKYAYKRCKLVRTSGRLSCLDPDQTCVVGITSVINQSDMSITSSYELSEILRIAIHNK